MRDGRWLWLRGEKPVEVGNAERLRWRNVEYAAGVIERAWADPSDAILNGMQNGEKVSALAAGRVSGDEYTVHRCFFFRRGLVWGEVQIHGFVGQWLVTSGQPLVLNRPLVTNR